MFQRNGPICLRGLFVAWALIALSVGLARGDDGEGSRAYRRSVALVEDVIRTRGTSARLARVLADVHARASRFEAAEAEYERALERYPEDAQLLAGLASVRLLRGDPDGAVELYRRAFVRSRGDDRADVGRSLAEALYEAGRFNEAVVELKRLVDGGVRDDAALWLLARSLDSLAREKREAGETAESVAVVEDDEKRVLERLVARRPDDRSARYLLARLLVRLGDREAAERELAAFAELARESRAPDERIAEAAERTLVARTAIELARALHDEGASDLALARIEVALRELPSDPTALVLKGWILLQTGEIAEAALAYEAALAREPRHPEALWNLGKIRLAQGEKEAAARLLVFAAKLRERAEMWEFLADRAAAGDLLSEEADALSLRALQMRRSPSNYARRASVLFKKGDERGSEAALEEGLRKFPGDALLLAALESLRAEPRPR